MMVLSLAAPSQNSLRVLRFLTTNAGRYRQFYATHFFQVIFPTFTLNHKKITALPVYPHLDITLC